MVAFCSETSSSIKAEPSPNRRSISAICTNSAFDLEELASITGRCCEWMFERSVRSATFVSNADAKNGKISSGHALFPVQ